MATAEVCSAVLVGKQLECVLDALAIKAVKTDTYGVTRLKYPHGTTPDPQNPPRGTQREYHLPTDHGEMKVFVYIQGGHINGWHVAK
jgi:hypothetical protein